MSKYANPLNNIKIASPCSADWNEMLGDERKRYCGDCKLNVYNLSEMTKAQAENLIIESEGSLCVSFYRRADGTVLTKDCPVGWQKIKNKTKVFATAPLLSYLVFSAR
jgi:Ni2+-binding GTPase involved in maturation of urease and hydrogenase